MFDAPARPAGHVLWNLLNIKKQKNKNFFFFVVHKKHLAESVPLIFTTTLPISVQDRQEHGQDVYTAECKHFPWTSLNKKSSKSPVEIS